MIKISIYYYNSKMPILFKDLIILIKKSSGNSIKKNDIKICS